MMCPRCGGAGIVDTSPPGVDRAPWLQTDMDCPDCAGTGLRHPVTVLAAIGALIARVRERLTR